MHQPNFTRPTRGAVRLDDLRWEIDPICKELEAVQASNWKDRPYGTNWSDIALFVRGDEDGDARHTLLDEMPALSALLDSFPAPVVDMCLAQLQPGGKIKPHRDISGGTAANIIRLHIPLITHPDVAFYVNGERIFMQPGEVWHLDTTYRHSVENLSDVNRIHLIIDLQSTPETQAMLPKSDSVDRIHTVAFYGICAGKAAGLLVRNPVQAFRRVKDFFSLRLTGRSVLYKKEDMS